MNDQTHFLTVVYRINDQHSFDAEHRRIMSHVHGRDTAIERLPWCVVHMSLDDELHRMELIAMAVLEGRYELIAEILALSGVDQIISLDELMDSSDDNTHGRTH